ncbi:MAG: hypothetical protein R2785_05380 [Flavobacteriaceae bacterium]
MPKMLSLKILFLFLISFSIQGQTKVFVDENMQEIDSISFYKKCDARVFKCLTYSTDSLIVNKVHNRFKFGKVSPEEYNQIRLLLMKKGNTEIAPDQILVIEHIDTIGGSYATYLKTTNKYSTKEKYRKSSTVQLNGEPAKIKITNPKIKSEKAYNKSYLINMKKPAKCAKKFESEFNTRVFMTYNYGKDKKHLYKGINWIEYPGVIIPKFLDQVDKGHYVILKPDGEYFVASLLLRDINLEELFKNSDWTKHKNDLKKSKTQDIKHGYGIFRPSVVINQNLNLCF